MISSTSSSLHTDTNILHLSISVDDKISPPRVTLSIQDITEPYEIKSVSLPINQLGNLEKMINLVSQGAYIK